ncbi:HEPN domain-containing protein [Actinocorallia sp. A-T 12471]|uniref:ApeA N-terminal domain 1-containing protein n=1 Tax=Actinocorallia sp. A-T 12471 TaxID=3089813 RepID=UPI0029CF53E8|nr:HEPN domain-containing protein [Actinocorallia sp. A-T 12471]MDX6742576.1 hypothetical protein [Actinocorallia sp. A-T 12471]
MKSFLNTGSYPGAFWVAGQPESTCHGRLILADDAPRIELDEMLTPGMRLVSTDGEYSCYEPADGGPECEDLTIHGRLLAPQVDITLMEAFTSSRTHGLAGFLNPSVGTQTLVGRYLLLGQHLDRPLFTCVEIGFQHLDEWAGLAGFESSEMSARTYALQLTLPDIPEAVLESGGMVTLGQHVELLANSVTARTISRTVSVRVLGAAPMTFDEVNRRILAPLRSLIRLCLGRNTQLTALSLAEEPKGPWVDVTVRSAQPQSAPIDRNRIFLPFADLGVEGIAAWLNIAPKIQPSMDQVSEFHARADHTIESMLQELTSVLEGTHTALHGKRKYRESVQGLVNDLRDVCPEATGQVDIWVSKVVTARNRFAHQDVTKHDSTASYIVLHESLYWVIAMRLFLAIGVPAETLRQRLARSGSYSQFLRRARLWLPEVYPSGTC